MHGQEPTYCVLSLSLSLRRSLSRSLIQSITQSLLCAPFPPPSSLCSSLSLSLPDSLALIFTLLFFYVFPDLCQTVDSSPPPRATAPGQSEQREVRYELGDIWRRIGRSPSSSETISLCYFLQQGDMFHLREQSVAGRGSVPAANLMID